jgi:hypothetical protein
VQIKGRIEERAVPTRKRDVYIIVGLADIGGAGQSREVRRAVSGSLGPPGQK